MAEAHLKEMYNRRRVLLNTRFIGVVPHDPIFNRFSGFLHADKPVKRF